MEDYQAANLNSALNSIRNELDSGLTCLVVVIGGGLALIAVGVFGILMALKHL